MVYEVLHNVRSFCKAFLKASPPDDKVALKGEVCRMPDSLPSSVKVTTLRFVE